jgi:hypothetical protein
MKYNKLFRVFKFITSSIDFPMPIRLQRVKLPKDIDGDCREEKDHFLIRIEKKLPEYYSIDVLIHEASHVLSWNETNRDRHGLEWGKAYSVLYRKFLEWCKYEEGETGRKETSLPL